MFSMGCVWGYTAWNETPFGLCMHKNLVPLLSIFLFCSGFTALTLEMVWLRRLALQLGSAGLSATATLTVYMGGLGFGSWVAGRIQWTRPLRSYGYLELFVACWAFFFPWMLSVSGLGYIENQTLRLWLVVPILLPPAMAHGATLPALSTMMKRVEDTGRLYAVNTLGAVVGVLGSAFALLPALGVRWTELSAMGVCLLIGMDAWFLDRKDPSLSTQKVQSVQSSGEGVDRVSTKALWVVGVVGFTSMSLEVGWSRLGALLIGGSVYAFAVVLAVFLSGIALGANWGRKLSGQWLPHSVAATGVLAICGAYSWRWLPHGLAVFWDWFGDGSLLWSGALLLSMAMCGAPVASGMVFSLALKELKQETQWSTAQILASNTFGGVLGVLLTGPLLMPTLGIVQTTVVLGMLCVLSSIVVYFAGMRSWIMVGGLSLMWVMQPKWDVAVYATGLYNRIGEFVDLSPRAIEQFAHEGWEPKLYVDGLSASIAVGQSTRTENLWLSINGKVDASTGADMPTQVLSGELPLTIHAGPSADTLVVGLASGVTANETLKHGATSLTVVELEPAIVKAAKLFAGVNDSVVDNPLATVRVADARAVLQQESTLYDIIISEPSNPWITGVSNLFTVEYWKLGHSRLRENGVFCQWVQLYALPPEGMRSLIASYLTVFPNTWLFETIPGSDALLISAQSLPENLPIQPTLTPVQLHSLTHGARLNTDDRPWIEFEAPKWVNRPTGRMNRELIEQAQSNP